MGFIKTSSMPNPPKARANIIPSLSGGINIHDIPWQVQPNQSPDMRNMWWEDGALRSRLSQVTINNGAIKDIHNPAAEDYDSRAYGFLYKGWYVIHCNKKFVAVTEDLQYFADVVTKEGTATFDANFAPGSFFLHNDILYYKAKGAYISITESEAFDETAGLHVLCAAPVEAYVPTILINADPNTKGAGNLYQPVNRLTTRRKVTYNCGPDTTSLILPEYASDDDVKAEYLTPTGDWVQMDVTVTRSIVQNKVTVKFSAIPDLTDMGSNNVRVAYNVAAESGQYDSIMDCDIASVYGGGPGMLVVMAGCDIQPNAYFWSANTDVAMDPGYFPVEHYNLAGDAGNPITAFGKQQNMLIIFQKNSIGRSVFGTTDIDGRTFITMDYTVINPRIGCDLPETIRLIDNNLVFANRRRGLMYIKDSSYAYENNIVRLSRNVDRSVDQPGLLYDINVSPKTARSVDDGERYWLCVNGHAWIWDYSLGGSLSDDSKMCWFYFDNIQDPSCWFGYEEHHRYFLGMDGYFREFKSTSADTFYDDGTWKTKAEEFEQLVTLPIQDFNTYEVLKNVNKCIFVVQGVGNAQIDIEYETDYETRKDRTPIITRGWSLVPRDLSIRSLKVFPFAVTAVRVPRCINVRHFLVRLRNATKGSEMAFVSAQIHYTYQGADR